MSLTHETLSVLRAWKPLKNFESIIMPIPKFDLNNLIVHMPTPSNKGWTIEEQRALEQLETQASILDQLRARRAKFKQLAGPDMESLLEFLRPYVKPKKLEGAAKFLIDNADQIVEVLQPFTEV